jgi:hypothetical protein
MFLAAILKAHTLAEDSAESATAEQKPKDETAAADITGSWPSFRPLDSKDLGDRTRWV